MAVRTLGAHPLLLLSQTYLSHLAKIRELISRTNDDVSEDSRCAMCKAPWVYPRDIKLHIQSSRPTGLEFGNDPFWAIDFMIASAVHQLKRLLILVDQFDLVEGDAEFLCGLQLASVDAPELVGLPVTREFVCFKQFLSCHSVVQHLDSPT